MFGNIVVRTKFIPPVLKTTFFPRKNLTQLFDSIAQYPVTLLQAGPGYGKSTSLASYFQGKDVFWYSVGKGDGDVLTFLLHLIYAFNTINPHVGEKTLNYIREKGENNQTWTPVLNSLINEIWDQYRSAELYLIIDDYHLLSGQPQIDELMEYLVEHRTPNLHLVISARVTPDFPSLPIWRVKDQILEIQQESLRLSQDEIRQFFISQYQYDLTVEEAEIIYNHTEGWVIALEMIWQGLKQGGTLQKIKNQPMTSLEHLFRYLAQEVLAKQRPEIRDFLVKTALLRVMTPDGCNFIRQAENSEEILRYLLENGLFTFQLDHHQYRYHHLFHDFLKGKARDEVANLDVLHKEVAEFFLRRDDFEEAIYHGMEGGDYFTAARILAKNAPQLLASGRFSTFTEWFNALPERIRESFPQLYLSYGDIARYTSNFKEALDWYNEARRIFQDKRDNIGLSLAFQRIAMIYLDTVQPARADKYLKKALALREKENNWEEITLIRLLAENMLNLGQMEEARKMQEKIHQLSEENTSYILDSRVKIRTGRLAEAEDILVKALASEGDHRMEQIAQAHRETYLLLSLIAVSKGDAEKALRYARLGLEQGEKLGSQFTRAVAYMRLGHAYQISGRADLGRAVQAYEEALRIVDELEVKRGRAEALWGLVQVYGHLGREAQMRSYGLEGLHICEEAGDEWLGSLIKLAMGIGYISLKDNKNAVRWLSDAVKYFDYCNDAFGRVMAQTWLALLDLKEGRGEDFKLRLTEIVPVVEEYHYRFIFTSITLNGPRDLTTLIPILTEGYNSGITRDFCQRLLEEIGVEPGRSHPGYTLRIQTLGKFRVLRGQEEVESGEWKRAKARTLFQIFLTHQQELLAKEQLAELLSPEKDEESALRDFKVALNALNNALEPEREARSTPFFIAKHGSRYGLNTASSYEIDVNQFVKLVKSGLSHAKARRKAEAMEDLTDGLRLYQGPYLPDTIYEDWSREERERLRNLFLQGAEILAYLYYEAEQYALAEQWTGRLLSEEPCLEEAYQLLMKSLARQGKRSRAVQAYKKCADRLQKELGVQPTQKTTQIYEQIKNATHL